MTKKGKSPNVSHSNEDINMSKNSCDSPSAHRKPPFGEHNNKGHQPKNIDSKSQSHTSHQSHKHKQIIHNPKLDEHQRNQIQTSTTNSEDDSSDEISKNTNSVTKNIQHHILSVAQKQTTQSAQKKKLAAAASSSDSDSSDDEQPVSKKPAIVKASPVVGKPAVSMVGGKKVVGKPASSSSDSDSSDDGGAVAVKKPVVAAGKPLSSGVPQTTPQSVQKKKVAAAASSSDSDSSECGVSGRKKLCLPADVGNMSGVCDSSVNFAASSRRVSFVSPGAMNSSVGSVSVCSGGVNGRKRAYSYVKDSDKLNGSANIASDTSFNQSETSITSVTPDSARKFRAGSTPFRRVVEDEVFVHPNLRDNSFDAKRNSHGSWGEKANRDFKFTSGKVFKQEKTKKKRGSYVGGSLSTVPCSFKFDDE
ncbi:unnamed protein product [Trichobilharzia szidati]|nr:unnamed protein product [Trichobilharzia szidati]